MTHLIQCIYGKIGQTEYTNFILQIKKMTSAWTKAFPTTIQAGKLL